MVFNKRTQKTITGRLQKKRVDVKNIRLLMSYAINLPEITEKEFSCNIDKDKRIKEYISNCIIESYNDYLLLQGYVFIVNLSDKRSPKSKELSEEDFNKKPDEIVKEIENKTKEQNNIKWIWIAFGKDSNGKDNKTKLKLKEMKEEVSNQLNILFPDKIIGKSVEYKHPYQRKIKEYEIYKQNVIKELRDFCTHVKP